MTSAGAGRWRVRGWLLVLLLGCGDNRTPLAPPDGPASLDTPLDAPLDPDTPPPLPDLRLVDGLMDGSITIMPDTFTATSCELEEQCIGAPGTRRLLRFDTVSENAGAGDLIVGMPPPQGVSDTRFTWSACHGHHHFNGYASYELIDGDTVVIVGRKQAFCILDSIQREAGKPSQGYTCLDQGLSSGWADVYLAELPCQWLDITDVPAGDYTLRVTVNPDHALPETDFTNNVYTRAVTL